MHMSITYKWNTFSIWEIIATFFPYHAKKYVMKWMKYRNDWIYSITVGHSLNDIEIQACLILKFGIGFRMPNPITAYGMSFRVVWENMLNNIAELENMKNVEELCIWLDMKDL